MKEISPIQNIVPAEIPANNLLDNALTDLAGQLSPRSKKTYYSDALHFARWLNEQNLSLKTLTRSHFIEYRQYLATRYAKKSTAERMLTVARRVLDEAVKRGDLPANPALDIRGFKNSGGNETPHTALTLEQANKMLAAVDRKTKRGQRDYALLKLFIQTGMRLAELADLQLGDLSIQQGHNVVNIRQGKGGKSRLAKLRKDVQQALEAYLDITGRQELPPNAPLFVPINKGDNVMERPLTTRQIERIVTGRAEAISLKLSPHALRATFITLALEGGAKLEQVQYAAGHTDPRTTERYQKRKNNLDNNAVDYIQLD